jgi:hypothetical protein
MMVPSKHCNETSDSIKDGEFSDLLRNYQLPKNECASWYYLLSACIS